MVKTITIYPTKDTYVMKSKPNDNFGDNTTLILNDSLNGAAYIFFPLSGLEHKTIKGNARVSLYVTDMTGDDTIASWVIEEEWQEKTLTWNLSQGISKRKLNKKKAVWNTGYHDIEVDNIEIQAYVDGSKPYYGFAFTSDWKGHFIDVNSREASTNKPYLTLVYEDTPPSIPTSLYPDGLNLDARGVIRFSWKHNSEEKKIQKGYVLKYSIDNGLNWVTIEKTTSNQYYDMPANTLPTTATVIWELETIDEIDGEYYSSPVATAKFNTAITPQKAPTLTSPLSGYLDGSKPIVFRWNFVGGTAEDKQGKYDLQYSLNQGVSWVTITNSSNQEEHILPENTFRSGNIYWRVRTYNTYGDVSPYSEIGSFYVINSPPMPQITDVTNNARPVITWNSIEQQIYELQILKNDGVIFETGSIPSESDRSYKLPMFLGDGEYLARLRVMNEYSLSSPWVEYMFIISTTKPQKPIIRLFSSEYSIVIRTEETSLRTLVYRDDKMIGEIKEGYFEDYTGENRKEYKYFIRAVDENDNFNDSDIKIGKCRFRDNTLALASKPNDFIKLRYGFNSEPQKSTKVGNVGSLIYFDGRKYPATEFTEFKEHAKTLSFFLRDKRELDNLIELIDKKQTLLYRDSEGENIYGTIFSIDYEKTTFGYDVSFTITKTSDYYD